MESEMDEDKNMELNYDSEPIEGDAIEMQERMAAEKELAEKSEPERPIYNVPGSDRRSGLSSMFRDWYLEYASYVILERAVPHIEDGLKPVQRRILHSMQTLEDGRYNKVANIVGNTMQYHPHGDASIGDALVQLGQKELLIDTQGNWGNILTGDSAAAPRYIEARLSEFALEAVYSPKITEWAPSYDGRKKEPVTLPVKFPLLLMQGVEGIAVGLSSKILPHNFNEILDAAVSCLRGEPFALYPDFQTGGILDVSRYNDGARGGAVKVRAKIEKIDNKTLAITELPFGKTTSTLITSILSAVEKGKIKIRKVEDNTVATAEIVVHLQPGTSSDMAIDALYAFTDCEISISPNCCVICDRKPHFISVSEMLRFSVNRTRELLQRELEIKLGELQETKLFASLEKIFIEERIYKDKETEQAADMDTAVAHVEKRLVPFRELFFRDIVRDDIMKLWEIRMGRILKFNSEKADEKIAALSAQVEKIKSDLSDMTAYTINWFTHLKEKYGAAYPRRTVIRALDSIVATKVADANKRLYYDKSGGFIGTGLKNYEFLFTCSDLDDVLVIYKDGTYKIVRVADKVHIGKKVRNIVLFKKNDERTTYNLIYRNGDKEGFSYMKRFYITGLTRDKVYNMTKGKEGSRIEYLSINPNGEAEVVRVDLVNEPNISGRRPRNKSVLVDFANIERKGKDSLGNLVTKYQIAKVVEQEKGRSTLGGREVWFDRDVLRINYEGRGESLGEFQGDDQILVITRDGEFFTSSYSDSNHYDDNILRIEKFDPSKIWTAVLFDPSLGFWYLKRFSFTSSVKPQRYVGNDNEAKLGLLTDTHYPRINVHFGGNDATRPDMEIDAESFIGVKSFKVKGKRVSTFDIKGFEELEPTRFSSEEQTINDEIKEIDSAEEESDSESEPVEGVEDESSEHTENPDEGPKFIQGELFDF